MREDIDLSKLSALTAEEKAAWLAELRNPLQKKVCSVYFRPVNGQMGHCALGILHLVCATEEEVMQFTKEKEFSRRGAELELWMQAQPSQSMENRSLWTDITTISDDSETFEPVANFIEEHVHVNHE